MIVQNGQLPWFDGPEWDDIAEESFRQSAEDVKQAAKDNAIWEDRTGDARNGLDAGVENVNGSVLLTLFHTVEYGLWLETIQNGHFAVILPTLEQTAPVVFDAAVRQISESRKGVDYGL